MSNLETREIQFRATDTEAREITALGVPYTDEYTEIMPGYWERFDLGSVELSESPILRYGHSDPIGIITGGEDTDDGYQITARISDTQLGRDVWQLVKDGALTRMSIGFEPDTYSVDSEDRITWTHVFAREFSIVEFPAYDAAKITDFRNNQMTVDTERTNIMTTETEEKKRDTGVVDELRATVETIERRLAIIADNTAPAAPPAPEFRSYGDFVHAFVSKDENQRTRAVDLYNREATGTSADYQQNPNWLGTLVKRMQAKQRITNLFTRKTLPASGLTSEYAVYNEDHTLKTAKQVKELDPLTSGLPGTWTVKSAPINTYGGQSGPISRQYVERISDISILDDIFTRMAYEYAVGIETATRELFQQTVTDNEKTASIELAGGLTALTVESLTDLLLEIDDSYDQVPEVFDGILVSPSVFKAIKDLDKNAKALQLVGAPDDKLGTVQLQVAGAATIGAFNIQRVPGWEGDHMAAYAKEAIVIAEQAGAPLRLQDEDISTLAKTLAVYGYASHYAPLPGEIKPVKLGEAG